MSDDSRGGARIQTVRDSDIRRREEQILGQPPRMTPLQAGQYGPEALEMLAALRNQFGGHAIKTEAAS